MTSVLQEEENKTARLKQKLMNDHTKEETRSFLSFSRENLSISHSDLEQGFNKHRFRPNRNTVLSIGALAVALLCLGLETWKLHCSLVNAREIEELKRDVESLKHRFLEEDLLDELKAFQDQLYAEESNDEDDPGEADIDNADYDSNYEDDVSSAHDYSGDYHTPPTYGARSSDFPDASSTIEPVPSPPDPTSNKELVELLATLRKIEAKRGQEFEKNVREGHRNIERERLLQESKRRSSHEERTGKVNGTKHKRDLRNGDNGPSYPLESQRPGNKGKRSVEDKIASGSEEVSPHRRTARNQTRRMIVSRVKFQEDPESRNPGENQNGSISGDRHPPKKYYAHVRADASHAFPSTHQDEPDDQIARASDKARNGSTGDIEERRFGFKGEQDTASEEIIEATDVQVSNGQSRQVRRGMTRRHLRAHRQVCAIHYGADSTLFAEEDEHTGNGRARHSSGVFKAWRPSNWVTDLGMNRYFTLASDGKLTVHEPGLYLVYAQIHYLDEHDENGFHVLVNGRPILQCMIYSHGSGHKSRSCFSAQVTLLQAGDRLMLKDVGSARYTLFQYDKSFFGLVKLGELRQQQKQ